MTVPRFHRYNMPISADLASRFGPSVEIPTDKVAEYRRIKDAVAEASARDMYAAKPTVADVGGQGASGRAARSTVLDDSLALRPDAYARRPTRLGMHAGPTSTAAPARAFEMTPTAVGERIDRPLRDVTGVPEPRDLSMKATRPGGPGPMVRSTMAEIAAENALAGATTVADDVGFDARRTTPGASTLAKEGTPTRLGSPVSAEAKTVLGAENTATVIDEARQVMKTIKDSRVVEGADEALGALEEIISTAARTGNFAKAKAGLDALRSSAFGRGVGLLGRGAGKLAGPLAIASTAYDAYQMGSALEDTQDPLMQLRAVQKLQGGGQRPIGRGGFSPADLKEMSDTHEGYTALLAFAKEGGISMEELRDVGIAPPLPPSPDDVTTDPPPPPPPNGPQGLAGTPVKRTQGAFPMPKGRSQVLSLGMTGNQVVDLQSDLVALGLLRAVDSNGVFDEKTRMAVRGLQRGSNIKVDGYFGPDSLKALDAAMLESTDAAAALEQAANDEIDASSTPKPAPVTPDFFDTDAGTGMVEVDELKTVEKVAALPSGTTRSKRRRFLGRNKE